MTNQARRRIQLVEDLHQWLRIELPAEFIMQELFSHVVISSWCRAHCIKFEVNHNPDPEFHVEKTIIFSYTPERVLNDDDYIEEEL